METSSALLNAAAQNIRSALAASNSDPELRRAFICEIQAALADVNPMSVEEWEGAFQRGADPVTELAFWLKVGKAYQRRTSQIESLDLQHRRQCLNRIVASAAAI
jgi:hypothetical protein